MTCFQDSSDSIAERGRKAPRRRIRSASRSSPVGRIPSQLDAVGDLVEEVGRRHDEDELVRHRPPVRGRIAASGAASRADRAAASRSRGRPGPPARGRPPSGRGSARRSRSRDATSPRWSRGSRRPSRRRRGRGGSCSSSRRPRAPAPPPSRARRRRASVSAAATTNGRWLIAATARSCAAAVIRTGRAPQTAISASTRASASASDGSGDTITHGRSTNSSASDAA